MLEFVLGMAGVVEVGGELVELALIVAARDDGARAQTVTEGVGAKGRFALGGFWAGRFRGVAAICAEPFLGGHHVFTTKEAIFITLS